MTHPLLGSSPEVAAVRGKESAEFASKCEGIFQYVTLRFAGVQRKAIPPLGGIGRIGCPPKMRNVILAKSESRIATLSATLLFLLSVYMLVFYLTAPYSLPAARQPSMYSLNFPAKRLEISVVAFSSCSVRPRSFTGKSL